MLPKPQFGSWHPCSRVLPWVAALALTIGPSSVEASPNGGQFEASSRFLKASGTIFRGKLVESNCFVDHETGDILTRYLFQVDETLKGTPSSLLEIVEYGGSVDGVTMVVPHAAQYRTGAEYLVFSWSDDWGRHRTVEGSRGALPLLRDGRGKKSVRLPPDHPLNSLLRSPKGLLVDFESISRWVARHTESEE